MAPPKPARLDARGLDARNLEACAGRVAALRRLAEAGGRLELDGLAAELAAVLDSLPVATQPPPPVLLALVDELEQLSAVAAKARDDAVGELEGLAARGRASRAYKGG